MEQWQWQSMAFNGGGGGGGGPRDATKYVSLSVHRHMYKNVQCAFGSATAVLFGGKSV